VTQWDSAPGAPTAIAGGDVIEYIRFGTTRYRFVPEPYDPTEDAFYATFDAGVLGSRIVSRI
jgi:hypothetical protein